MALTAEQRSLRSRIAAYAANARHDGRAITAQARATYRESFLTGHSCRVCPATALPSDLSTTERARRGEMLRRAHYARLALKSSRVRSKRRAGPDRTGPAHAMEGSSDAQPTTG
ncbi:MAG TPA: hypothetical protein VMQ65_01860 [Candidatus Limnocylindria bacterium]|nr:hypothetical protein [Candidatus Limnocylindria bacterium]